jgi:hypothetical protein
VKGNGVNALQYMRERKSMHARHQRELREIFESGSKRMTEAVHQQHLWLDQAVERGLSEAEQNQVRQLVVAREEAFIAVLDQLIEGAQSQPGVYRLTKRTIYFGWLMMWISGFLARPFLEKYVFPLF